MILFFIGILEMVIVTLWTEAVSRTKVVASGVVTFVNILIWYYVLQLIVDDINNWQLVLVYALGCVVGTVLTTSYFSYRKKQRRAEQRARNAKLKLDGRLAIPREG